VGNRGRRVAVPADLASNAAAVGEGYARIQTDWGATKNPRYQTRYEKMYDGDAQSGGMRLIDGYDNVSQANADTNALNSLNAFRRNLYGTDTSVNKGPRSRQTLTVGLN
jgi:hypothetical protein